MPNANFRRKKSAFALRRRQNVAHLRQPVKKHWTKLTAFDVNVKPLKLRDVRQRNPNDYEDFVKPKKKRNAVDARMKNVDGGQPRMQSVGDVRRKNGEGGGKNN